MSDLEVAAINSASSAKVTGLGGVLLMHAVIENSINAATVRYKHRFMSSHSFGMG